MQLKITQDNYNNGIWDKILKVNSYRNVIEREAHSYNKLKKELVAKRSKIENEKTLLARINKYGHKRFTNKWDGTNATN